MNGQLLYMSCDMLTNNHIFISSPYSLSSMYVLASLYPREGSKHDNHDNKTHFLIPPMRFWLVVHSIQLFLFCFLFFYFFSPLLPLYQVRHTPTGQVMVLKRNKRKTQSMLKEVELLKRLHHPNILQWVLHTQFPTHNTPVLKALSSEVPYTHLSLG